MKETMKPVLGQVDSKTLDTFGGVSKAKLRWQERNERQEQERKRDQEIREITDQLKDDPALLAFMKLAATCTGDHITAVTEQIRQMGDTA